MRSWQRFGLLFTLSTMTLVGCARDDNGDLRARLGSWFALKGTLYFESRMRCTAAVYRVDTVEPKTALPVQRDPSNAKRAFRTGRVAAIQMAGYSPNDLADSMLLSGNGLFGKQVLAAAAQSVPCFEGTSAEGQLRTALTRAGGLLAYDLETDGLIVLDPVAEQLFYVAGDVW